MSRTLLSCSVLLIAIGCQGSTSSEEIPPVRTAAPAVSETADPNAPGEVDVPATSGSAGTDVSADAMQTFDGMKFRVPAGWKQQQLSPMQVGIVAAKFGMPEFGDELTLTLSTSGGSVADNISRWEGQFQGGSPMRTETMSIDGKEATVVRLDGTFSAGFGKPPESGWQMTGVIIPLGTHHYFLKLTGPIEAVVRAEEQFLEFCRSARSE